MNIADEFIFFLLLSYTTLLLYIWYPWRVRYHAVLNAYNIFVNNEEIYRKKVYHHTRSTEIYVYIEYAEKDGDIDPYMMRCSNIYRFFFPSYRHCCFIWMCLRLCFCTYLYVCDVCTVFFYKLNRCCCVLFLLSCDWGCFSF